MPETAVRLQNAAVAGDKGHLTVARHGIENVHFAVCTFPAIWHLFGMLPWPFPAA